MNRLSKRGEGPRDAVRKTNGRQYAVPPGSGSQCVPDLWRLSPISLRPERGQPSPAGSATASATKAARSVRPSRFKDARGDHSSRWSAGVIFNLFTHRERSRPRKPNRRYSDSARLWLESTSNSIATTPVSRARCTTAVINAVPMPWDRWSGTT